MGWGDSVHQTASSILDAFRSRAPPFFCQREAVKTVLYLTEILGAGKTPRFKPKLSLDDFRALRGGERVSFAAESRIGRHASLAEIPNEPGVEPLHRPPHVRVESQLTHITSARKDTRPHECVDDSEHLRKELMAGREGELGWPGVHLGQLPHDLTSDLERDRLQMCRLVVGRPILLLELKAAADVGRADLVSHLRLHEHRGRIPIRLEDDRLESRNVGTNQILAQPDHVAFDDGKPEE
jgi:hypothetical protein